MDTNANEFENKKPALTDILIRKINPKSKHFEIPDGQGLYLRIAPSGRKTFVFRYMLSGVARRMKIGSFYPEISLSEARERHQRAIGQIAGGIDPAFERQKEKRQFKEQPTVKDIVDEYWERELLHKQSGKQTLGLLKRDVITKWGKLKVSTIKRRDIVLLLDSIAERAPVVRNRVHGALSRLFNFAAERGVIEDSPCTRIRKLPEKGRNRVLTNEEIKSLWAALDLENKDVDIYRVSKLALKMILLTGQRPGEVCGMAWNEISEDNFWIVPAERMKNREPNRVPLCPMALDVIEEAKTYSGDCDFVFRSSYKPKEAMTRHAITRAVNRHWQEMGLQKAFTPHDLRRTLRTRLAELGVSDVVAERVIGHKLQGMMAVYNQHAYDAEKRQALMKWENLLKEIIGLADPKESNIVDLISFKKR